jgi:hypothetical protein
MIFRRLLRTAVFRTAIAFGVLGAVLWWLAIPAAPALPTIAGLTSADGHGDGDDAPVVASVPLAAPAPVFAADECRASSVLGRVAVWNPDGPKRVGLQAGHWLTQVAPDELARLRTQTGTTGGGYTEWQVNLNIAERTAVLLEDAGIAVDVLPTTLPPCYEAHAFVSIHADGDLSAVLNGFKVARARSSPIAETDDALVAALNQQYALATGLRRDDAHISGRMLNYYALGSRRSIYSIALGVPSAIIETGFLTNPADRLFLTRQTDRVAAGIANGILQFLGLEVDVTY